MKMLPGSCATPWYDNSRTFPPTFNVYLCFFSLFSATKRKARGYCSTEYQIAMLYFVAGKLEIPYYG